MWVLYGTAHSAYTSVIESGVVIQHSGKVLRNEAKMHFNRLMHHAQEFEKFLHQGLGPDIAQAEDDINSAIVDMVWKLYDLDSEERDKFIQHINAFEDNGSNNE